MAGAEVAHLNHNRFAQPMAAKSRLDEKIVHYSTQPTIGHGMAKRDHDIANFFGVRLDEPHESQALIR
jgi:hypothetical protein